ncbi:MAG: hypothetical protein KatS3mg102_2037 [Planctomycetota bacterium]|nr:MAG: hypothetical protein KatS3mg102_2037 [Planctomycetota bacterium]
MRAAVLTTSAGLLLGAGLVLATSARATEPAPAMPPLAALVRAGDAEALEAALAAGADPDALDPADGALPLIEAAAGGQERCLELLLAHGARLQSAAGRTALLEAAWQGRGGVVQRLLARGVDPDARGSAGETALHRAALQGHAEVVRQLLAAGADPEAADGDGRPPLLVAVASGHGEVVQALLQAGARPEPGALRAARALGHQAIARALAAAASPTAVIRLGPGDDLLAACASAPDGARLVLQPGRYEQPLVVRGRRRLVVLGAGPERTVVAGGGGLEAAAVAVEGAELELRALALAPTGSATVGAYAAEGASMALEQVSVEQPQRIGVYVAGGSLRARGLRVRQARDWAIGAVRSAVRLRELELQDCARGIALEQPQAVAIRGLRYRGGAPVVQAAGGEQALILSDLQAEHRPPAEQERREPALLARTAAPFAARGLALLGFARGIDVATTSGAAPVSIADAVVLGGEVGVALEAPAASLVRLEQVGVLGSSNAGVLASGSTRLIAIDTIALAAEGAALALIESGGARLRGGAWLGLQAALGIERRGGEPAPLRCERALLFGALLDEGEPPELDPGSRALRAAASWPTPAGTGLRAAAAAAVSRTAGWLRGEADFPAGGWQQALHELTAAVAAVQELARTSARLRLEATDATGRRQVLGWTLRPAGAGRPDTEPGALARALAEAPELQCPELEEGWHAVPPGRWWLVPQPGSGLEPYQIELLPRSHAPLHHELAEALWITLPPPPGPGGQSPPALLVALRPADERAALVRAVRRPLPAVARAVARPGLSPAECEALQQQLREQLAALGPPPQDPEAARAHAWRRWALVRLAAALGQAEHARAIAARLRRLAAEDSAQALQRLAPALWCAALARIEARLGRLGEGELVALASDGPAPLRPWAAAELAAWGERGAVQLLLPVLGEPALPASALWAVAPLLEPARAQALLERLLALAAHEQQSPPLSGLLLLAAAHGRPEQLAALLSRPLPYELAPELLALAAEPDAVCEQAYWLWQDTTPALLAQLAAMRTAPAGRWAELLEAHRRALLRGGQAWLEHRGETGIAARLEQLAPWLAVHHSALLPQERTAQLLHGDHVHVPALWWLAPPAEAAQRAAELLRQWPPEEPSWLDLVPAEQGTAHAELLAAVQDEQSRSWLERALAHTRLAWADPLALFAAPDGRDWVPLGLRSRSETGGALLATARLELRHLGAELRFDLALDAFVHPELGLMALFPREDWEITPYLDDPLGAALGAVRLSSPQGTSLVAEVLARPHAQELRGAGRLDRPRLAGTIWLDFRLIEQRRRVPIALELTEAARRERLAARALARSPAPPSTAAQALAQLELALQAGDAARVQALGAALLSAEEGWQAAAAALLPWRDLPAVGELLLQGLAAAGRPPAAQQLAAALLGAEGRWQEAGRLAEQLLVREPALEDARLIAGLAAVLDAELPRAVSRLAALQAPELRREAAAPLAWALGALEPAQPLEQVQWLQALAADPDAAPLPLLVLTGRAEPEAALEHAGYGATAMAVQACAGLRARAARRPELARRWLERARQTARQLGARGSFWDRLAEQALSRP